MIELLITISISAIVLGVMTMLFGFASVRLSDTYTQSALYDQVNGVADRVEANIRKADSCASRDAGATLVCSMPQNGIDTDGDGQKDTYYPDKTDANGAEQYTVGSYVWFYNAGSTGAYSVGSGGVWRSERTTVATVTLSDVDSSFGFYYGSVRRYPLVASASFVVNAALKTVTFTITGSTRMGSESGGNADGTTLGRTVTVTRTVEWRN